MSDKYCNPDNYGDGSAFPQSPPIQSPAFGVQRDQEKASAPSVPGSAQDPVTGQIK